VGNPVNFIQRGSLFPSGSQGAATYYSTEYENLHNTGIILFLNVSAGTGTLTPTLQAWDPGTQSWVDYGSAFTAQTGVGARMYRLYPHLTASAGLDVPAPLPARWRLKSVVTTAAVTATIGSHVLK
jgi:hypothetical protein